MMTPALYRICDGASEVLLFFAVVFGPWAFGTTEAWSIWIMNGVGFGLGLLLLAKRIIRCCTGYIPPRWDSCGHSNQSISWEARLIRSLAWSTAFLLLYCLIAAINARVAYEEQNGERLLAYFDSIQWLPHSYDRDATWLALAVYVGLAGFFWGAWDVLGGKSAMERHFERENPGASLLRIAGPRLMPERIRRLLWVLCLNGGWLAIVSIAQRIDGTDKLLWIMERQSGFPTEFSFGPFAYRGNAAEYFNLIWPVCLGFWWIHRAPHLTRPADLFSNSSRTQLVLLAEGVLMALCPIISGNLPGAWLSLVALAGFFAVILGYGLRRHVPALWMLFVALFIGVAGFLISNPMKLELPSPELPGSGAAKTTRAIQNASTWRMIGEHPTWGVGPYAYRSAAKHYRMPGETGYSFAHNDWLQTLSEWGWAATLTLAISALLPWLRVSRANVGLPVFVGSIAIGTSATLTAAAYSFPFQIQSILTTALLLWAIILCLPDRSRNAG